MRSWFPRFTTDATVVHDDTAIVEAIAAIGDEFDFYGRRRVNESMALAGSISAQEPPINRRSFPELSASTFPRPATRRSSDPVVRRARSLVEPSALGF